MSSKQAKQSSRTRHSNSQEVRRHADWLETLPEPPEEFRRQDVPKEYRGTFDAVARTNLIKRVRSETFTQTGNRRERGVYKLPRWVLDELNAILAHRDVFCPCGHSGIQNHGGEYSCGFEACDKTFTRDEVEVGN